MKNSTHQLLLCISLILCQTTTLQAFQVTSSGIKFTKSTTSTSSSHTRPSLQTLRMADENKEEEIAKLEAQLRKLREESSQDEEGDALNGGKIPEAKEVVDEGMFLSEGWKETDSAKESEGSGMITNVLGAIGLAVFLALFSQIPIGQDDYSKYSAVKASADKIDLGDINRARQSSDL